jgi:putative transposase
MARQARRDIVTGEFAYHLIVRGNHRARVFLCREDFDVYVSLMFEAKRRHRIAIFHYVLMPNHVHLLVHPGDGDLSRFMHHIQTQYAKYFCKKNGLVGHVWQDRFKSLLIENDAYLLACGNYIEMNPVRAKMVSRPEHWPYSSYRSYAFGDDHVLTDEDPLYSGLATDPEGRQKRYRELVRQTRAA